MPGALRGRVAVVTGANHGIGSCQALALLTRITDTGWVTDEVRSFVEHSPDHHHVAAPSEVAEIIAWLCTDAARLVTGNVLRLR